MLSPEQAANRRLTRARIVIAALVSLLFAGDAWAQSRRAPRSSSTVTVSIGRPRDLWASTLELTYVGVGNRNGALGFEVRVRASDGRTFTLFWPRDRIDFRGNAPGYRLVGMRTRTGRLWYPNRLTARSLPRAHEWALYINDYNVRQANGASAALQGFALVAGVGMLVPGPRAPLPAPRSARAPSLPTARTLPASSRAQSVAAARTAPARSKVWELAPFPRGRAIEQAIGTNLPANFPVIDRFARGTATSIKSIDLGAKTYQNTAALTRTVTRYVDALARFGGRTWGGATVRGSDITRRVLELVVPRGGASAAQQVALQTVARYGETVGVTVRIIPF